MSQPQQIKRAPAIFLSHGAGPLPVFAEDHESYRALLRKHSHLLGGVKAIILFSAHWETDEPRISGLESPAIFYDYEHMRDVLPKQAFELQYDAKGDAGLAKSIADRLRSAGFSPVIEDRPWDHGVYVPMSIMLPQGNIPIVEMSVLKGQTDLEATEKNFRLGEVMETFRDEGYAVVGSGGSWHDFRRGAAAYFGDGSKLTEEEVQFEEFVKDIAETKDPELRKKRLCAWREAPGNVEAHVIGEAEHFMPYVVAAASGGQGAGRRLDILWLPNGMPYGFYIW